MFSQNCDLVNYYRNSDSASYLFQTVEQLKPRCLEHFKGNCLFIQVSHIVKWVLQQPHYRTVLNIHISMVCLKPRWWFPYVTSISITSQLKKKKRWISLQVSEIFLHKNYLIFCWTAIMKLEQWHYNGVPVPVFNFTLNGFHVVELNKGINRGVFKTVCVCIYRCVCVWGGGSIQSPAVLLSEKRY